MYFGAGYRLRQPDIRHRHRFQCRRTQSGAQQEESTLTGKLDEKKDFMFVVTDDQGASYQFSIDSSAKPEGYDDVAVGDSVTVTYTGALSEVDPFEGTIASVEKVK